MVLSFLEVVSKKKYKFLFVSVLTYLFVLTGPALAWQEKVTQVGDRYGIELDVVFTYTPERENLARWKSVFSGASQKLAFGSNGHFS